MAATQRGIPLNPPSRFAAVPGLLSRCYEASVTAPRLRFHASCLAGQSNFGQNQSLQRFNPRLFRKQSRLIHLCVVSAKSQRECGYPF
jgi:hypothetical protein